eukprot:scaffold3377_cov99-Cylindrotheca_fusiformis.AAC.2
MMPCWNQCVPKNVPAAAVVGKRIRASNRWCNTTATTSIAGKNEWMYRTQMLISSKLRNHHPQSFRIPTSRKFSHHSAAATTTGVTTSSKSRRRQVALLVTSSSFLAATAAAIAAIMMEGQAENWWMMTKRRDGGMNDEENDDDIMMLPRIYDRDAIQIYWKQRPISVMKRLGEVLVELGPIAIRYLGYKATTRDTKTTSHQEVNVHRLHDEQVIGALSHDFKEALTNLGPAWIKAGQQLAIRPDLVHPIVLKELEKLCDSVRTTMSKEQAIVILEQELGPDKVADLDQLELVASASLGQVYKASMNKKKSTTTRRIDGALGGGGISTTEDVAIKIQRPGMLKSFSLDLYLLQRYGELVDAFTSKFTKQPPFHSALFDNFSKGSYSELDYEQEAQNQLIFKAAFAKHGLEHKVKVPAVYTEYTNRRVITTEWIDGIPLAKSSSATIQRLIPVGVELFLTQLLDIGIFHADPHVPTNSIGSKAGNILVTSDTGKLCLLDFGLCVTVNSEERQAMTKALVHLLYRDFDTLIAQDSKDLGFLPRDFDTELLKPILKKVLTGGLLEAGSQMDNRRRKLGEISAELNDIFFEYPFQVPPFFALITRGLGLLEGIALTGDPDFDIFKASLPFIASKRAVSLLMQSAAAAAAEPGARKATGNLARDDERHASISKDEKSWNNKRNFFSSLVSKWQATEDDDDN